MSTDEHNWFHDHATAYVMGGLSADERTRIESHRAACRECAAHLSAIKETDLAMNNLFEKMRPSAGFEQSIIDQLDRPMRLLTVKVNPLVRRAAVAAAVAIVLGGVGYAANEKINNNRWPTLSLSQTWHYGRVTNTAQNRVNWNGNTAALTKKLNDPYEYRSAGENVMFADGHSEPAGALVVSGGVLLPTDKDATVLRKSDEAPRETTGLPSPQAMNYVADQHLSDIHAALPAPAPLPSFQPFGVPDNQPAHGMIAGSGGAFIDQTQLGFSARQRSVQAEAVDKLDATNAMAASPAPADAPAPSVAPVQAAPPATPPAAPPATPPTVVSAPTQPDQPPPMQRKVIRNGTMEFIVDSFDSSLLQVTAIVAEEGGYIGTTNSQKMPNGKVSGTISIRVSPDHLDVLVLKLRALGELKDQKITSEDINKEYTDLASELRAARAMEDRLLDLIKDGKGAIKDLLAAEKELGEWREKIEKITGQMNYYDNLVAMSTLELTLTEKDIKTPALASQTETVDMGVETEDVEKSRAQALAAIDEIKGRVVESELKQLDAGQLEAKVVADLSPDKAGPVIDHLKQLGTVSRLEVQRQEVTTDGQGNPVDADTLPPGVRVEQKDTRLTLSLYNLANVAPRQTANVELVCDDVDASYHAILDRVKKSGGRVLSSNLSQARPEQVTGLITFEVKSEDADGVLLDVKQAGEVLQASTAENTDTTNVTSSKRGFSVELRSFASVMPREVATLSIATSDVTAAYDKLLATVAGLKGRIVLSRIDKEEDDNGIHNELASFVDFEVKRNQLDTVDHAFADSGDLLRRSVLRSNDDQNTLESKLEFKVAFHNATIEPAREAWNIAIESGDVDAAQADVLSAAKTAGGHVLDSTISKEANGRSTAHVVIEVPMAQTTVVVDQVKHEGEVRVVESTKNPQASAGPLAQSRLDITIGSPDAIVSEGHGLWGSIRAGLSTSVAGLLWSLQMIVVGLCFVVPWVAAVWVVWRVLKRRRTTV